MRIRIEKIAEVQGGLPANPKDAHIDGQIQNENFSLPVEYWAEGELLDGIRVGCQVRIARDIRNGVVCPGLLETSSVTEVTETQFKTKNSVYNYRYV
jgi:hypothetical protein